MRWHRRHALGLAVAGLALGLAGCGSGPRGFYESGPPRVPAGGSFTIEPGQDVVVYGVRSQYCGMEPPTFEAASQEMFAGEGSEAPAVGEVYDAGLAQRVSVPCGGTVPARAIGYRAPADFEGEVSMVFYGSDQATVTVALPEPEPDEAGEGEAESDVEAGAESEPAPLPDPDVEAPSDNEPVGADEAGPPESPLEEPPVNEPR